MAEVWRARDRGTRPLWHRKLSTDRSGFRLDHPLEEDAAVKNSQDRIGRPRLVLSHAKVLALSPEGRTIREIAEEMGVSPASIHRILKGHHHISGEAISV